MLDYYGSIIIKEDEIVEKIINSYQNKYETETLKKIIKEMMDEGKISKEYSVSGWMVFFGKDIIEKVENKYKEKLNNAKKRLEFSKILHKRLSPDKIGNQDPYIVEEIIQ
jgi:polyhydroxyalkanoate synthesis regulator phasin